MSDLGFKANEANVVLTMVPSDWCELLLAMGYAIGTARRIGDQQLHDRMLALVNRLNVGNPNFTPYTVKKNPIT